MTMISEVQEQAISTVIKYSLITIQYIGIAQKIPKNLPRQLKTYFVHITDEGIQIRSVSKDTIGQLIAIDDFNETQLIINSSVEDFIQYELMIKAEGKVYNQAVNPHFVIGLYSDQKIEGVDKPKLFLVFRLESEKKMNQCVDEINLAIKQQKDYIKKSVTNFLGIEENLRKIIEKVMLSTQKGEVYARLDKKMREKNIELTGEFNKMMLYSLMGNHPQIMNLIRKQKIEAYDIEKRKYDDFLKTQNQMADVIDPIVPEVIQKYSQKRKMDGVIVKRQAQKQQRQNQMNKNVEQLYISKIPEREEYEIDGLIGIELDVEDMNLQNQVREDHPIVYRAEKIKIPVKQYSIIGSRDMQFVQKQRLIGNESLDEQSKTAVESVKFMYQLMRRNSEYNSVHGTYVGPMDKVLDCLKDVLTECSTKIQERRNAQRSIENKSLIEFIQSANKNYMEYRRYPNKFY